MHLLYITDAFTQMVHTFSAVIALVIGLYFMVAYKKYNAQVRRHELLDRFLQD